MFITKNGLFRVAKLKLGSKVALIIEVTLSSSIEDYILKPFNWYELDKDLEVYLNSHPLEDLCEQSEMTKVGDQFNNGYTLQNFLVGFLNYLSRHIMMHYSNRYEIREIKVTEQGKGEEVSFVL